MAEFDEIVYHYGNVDRQVKEMSKELEETKIIIKNTLKDMGVSDYTAGGYKVTRQVRYKTKIDTDKMLSILKSDWVSRFGDTPCPYIKTIEYVDTEALESVLYNEELPKDVMEKLSTCETKTEEIALKCTKVKEK